MTSNPMWHAKLNPRPPCDISDKFHVMASQWNWCQLLVPISGDLKSNVTCKVKLSATVWYLRQISHNGITMKLMPTFSTNFWWPQIRCDMQSEVLATVWYLRQISCNGVTMKLMPTFSTDFWWPQIECDMQSEVLSHCLISQTNFP